ncbi:hypothetical protein, partial [Prauserella flavalba]
MTGSENGSRLNRRSLLITTSLATAAVLPVGAAAYASPAAAAPWVRRYPSNWPDLEPYGLADTRLDLWPRDDNSFIL